MAEVSVRPRDVRPAAQTANAFRPRLLLTAAGFVAVIKARTFQRTQGSLAEKKPETVPVAPAQAGGTGFSPEKDRGAQEDTVAVITNDPVAAQRLGILAMNGRPAFVRAAQHNRVLLEPPSVGIAVGMHYPTPIQLSKALSFLGKDGGAFPDAGKVPGQIRALPLFPHLTAEPQTFVVDVLRRIL